MTKVRLKRLGPNATELVLGEKVILFSYGAPVAVRSDLGIFKTARFWSRATQAHLKTWIAGRATLPVGQLELETLLGGKT